MRPSSPRHRHRPRRRRAARGGGASARDEPAPRPRRGNGGEGRGGGGKGQGGKSNLEIAACRGRRGGDVTPPLRLTLFTAQRTQTLRGRERIDFHAPYLCARSQRAGEDDVRSGVRGRVTAAERSTTGTSARLSRTDVGPARHDGGESFGERESHDSDSTLGRASRIRQTHLTLAPRSHCTC